MAGSLEVKEEKKKAVLEIERVAMRDLEHLDGCVNTMIMLVCLAACMIPFYRIEEHWSQSHLWTSAELAST